MQKKIFKKKLIFKFFRIKSLNLIYKYTFKIGKRLKKLYK